MIKVCRLSISYTEESKSMDAVLADAMQKAGVTMDDIQIDGPNYGSKTHYGNWVLTPVLDNESTAKLAEVLKTKTDMHREFLEVSDIQSMTEGARVKVHYPSDFGFDCAGEGKIIRKTGGELTILKKGSRSKGWTFRPWDAVKIETY